MRDANEKGIPVLSHSWSGCKFGGPAILGKLAEQYQNVSVLVAHSATNWEMIDAVCEEAKKRENLYLDLTGSGLHFRALEVMVERVGADRVLFGTDIPFIDPRPGLGRVVFARLEDDDKRKILGLNAKRLFEL